jgi:hypothetical protein
MGASWPRGWDNVTTSVALFTVGSVWQKSNEAGTRVLRLPARLLALCAPIAALGRMPRMVLLGYSVVVIALHSIAAN